MTAVTLAAAQIECRPGDVAANLALHRGAIAEARDRGVDLLVFPELSLTDYLSHPDLDALARAADCQELGGLAEASRGLVAVVGFMERGPDGRAYNAAAILAEGRVALVHRKLNVPGYGALVEPRYYAEGAALDLAATAVGRLACLVCADTWNPALPWLAALKGADLLAVPIASSRGAVAAVFDSRDGWEVNLRHTALTYGLPVVMANHCGARGGLDFWGGSAILDAFGRVVGRAGEGPGLILARVDPADTMTARMRLPTMRDARPDWVAAALGREREPR